MTTIRHRKFFRKMDIIVNCQLTVNIKGVWYNISKRLYQQNLAWEIVHHETSIHFSFVTPLWPCVWLRFPQLVHVCIGLASHQTEMLRLSQIVHVCIGLASHQTEILRDAETRCPGTWSLHLLMNHEWRLVCNSRNHRTTIRNCLEHDLVIYLSFLIWNMWLFESKIVLSCFNDQSHSVLYVEEIECGLSLVLQI